MNFIKGYTNFFKNYFPSPFTIAILLTLLTFLLALFFTETDKSILNHIPDLAVSWYQGILKTTLLAFTIKMMLILVLGHVIALSNISQNIINIALKYCTNTANSVFFVTFLTILVSLFNWGLGLIFGAIFARKIGEHFYRNHKKLNYPLVGAAAYVGLMVWHGGLSGSAPITVASETHTFFSEMGSISISETIFSNLNIFASISLLIIVPLSMYLIGKKSKNEIIPKLIVLNIDNQKNEIKTPSERLEQSKLFGVAVGILMLLVFILIADSKLSKGKSFYSVIELNTTILILFGLALVLHKSIKNFLNAIDNSIKDVSGILIQFPLYFGIMGLMKESGMATMMAQSMTQSSTEFSLPIYTFISSGIINLFVPSGGGQWQIQAPIIIESAKATGVSLPKMIMALAYGDQLTNMLQPFWALPLLGITGLKAKDILPYTLILFFLGGAIYLSALLLF